MTKMINFSGQELQRNYSNGAGSVITDKQREQQRKDFEALRKITEAKKAKTARREALMTQRDDNRESLDVKLEKEIELIPIKEQQKIKDIKESAERLIGHRLIKAKEKTNLLARQHGLPEPNNPEAVRHDRLHCYNCDTTLHLPNAYKSLDEDIASLFDDESVRHLCCFCFSKMSHEEITIRKGEATPEIRMAVYNPEEAVRKNVDISGTIQEVKKMSDLDRIRLKSKIKQYKNVINLIGNVKYDALYEADRFENQVIYGAKTRYTACSWGL